MELQTKLDTIERNIGLIDDFAITTLSRASTWLAPLVPAGMVYTAAQRHIADVGALQAFVIAAVVELLGLGVVSNWLGAQQYNRTAGEEDRLAMRPYVTLVGVYAALVLVVVVGLKISPGVFSWGAIVALSLLSLASAVAFVQRRQLTGLLADQEERAAMVRELERKELRAAHRAKLQAARHIADVERQGNDHLTEARRTKAEERRLQLVRILESQGGAGRTSDLAAELSASPSTIRRDLEAVGASLNGDGLTWHL